MIFPNQQFKFPAAAAIRTCAGFTLLGLLAMVSAPVSAAPSVRFERFQIPATDLKNLQVHPVNVLGGPELEFLLVSTDGTVSVVGQTATGFTPVQSFPLPLPPGEGQHLYYGFARVEDKERYSLVVLSPGSVTYYPLENNLISGTPKILFQTKLVSQQSPGRVHRYFDMALDFNNDGFDELLLPSDNGFTISRRTEDGSYTSLSLPRDSFSTENTFAFSRDIPDDPVRPAFYMTSLTRRQGIDDLLFFDADGDDRLDLIYSSTGIGPNSKQVERYDVFLQKNNLQFSDKPSQSFAVPYDSQADATFRDINQDGRLDAILVRSNLDIVNPRTVVKFYIGESDGYQVFSQETDRFVTKDPVGLVQLNDFNSDGISDFAMTFFSYQFGSMEDIVDLAFANKLQFRLQYFLGRGKEGFPRKPDAEVPVTLNTKLEDFRGNPPVMIVDDMNRDKMMDLVVRSSANEIQLFLSQGNFSIGSSPVTNFRIPENANLTFIDANLDGLGDIIVSDPTANHLSIIVPLPR